MQWDKLQHFYLIATEGTISGAAKRLGVEQSSVTRSLKILEESLGTDLFIRTPRGVTLTDDGKILLQHVRKMIIEAEDALSSLDKNKNEVGGEIRITTGFGLSSTGLFQHLIGFKRIHPEIQLKLICDDEELDLRIREADVSIRPFVHNGDQLVQEYLTTRIQHLYASKEYLDKNGVPKTITDLKKHKIIIFNNLYKNLPYSQVSWFVELLSSLDGYQVEPCMILNSVECLYQAAIAGLGIISLSNDSTLLNDKRLIRILPEICSDELKMYYVYPRALKSSKSVIALLEYLKFSYQSHERPQPLISKQVGQK